MCKCGISCLGHLWHTCFLMTLAIVVSAGLFFFLYIGLLEMTQLMRKLPIALRLILRDSPGPTA